MAGWASHHHRQWLCLALAGLLALAPAAAEADGAGLAPAFAEAGPGLAPAFAEAGPGFAPADADAGSGLARAFAEAGLGLVPVVEAVPALALAAAEAGSGLPSGLRRPPDAADVVRRLEQVTRWAPGVVSVWYYDLTSHEYFGLRADETHTAASTVKVLIANYLYHLAATGQLSLDDPVTIRPIDWKDGSGILNGAPDGTRLTLREAARLMLVHSDNTAANALMRRLGVQPMVQYYRSLGIRYGTARMHTPQQLWQENRIAPEDLGIVLRNIWEAARRSPEPWAELLRFMQQSHSKGRIPGGLPPDVPVANKTGSKGTSFHDAAIVLDRRPYVLVVMTQGMTVREASYYIASVSREVWGWHRRRAAHRP